MILLKREEAGFTLIELMIVIIVIGVLTGISILAFGSSTTYSIQNSCKTTFNSVLLGLQGYQDDHGNAIPASLDTLAPTYLNSNLIDNSRYSLVLQSLPGLSAATQILVANTGNATLEKVQNIGLTAGVPVSFFPPGLDANAVTYSITPSLSSGLTFDTSTGIISGTPNPQAYTLYTITATDSDTTSSTYTFPLVVNSTGVYSYQFSDPSAYNTVRNLDDGISIIGTGIPAAYSALASSDGITPNTITLNSADGVTPGMTISGASIPSGATVTTVTGTTVTYSSTGSSATTAFSNLPVIFGTLPTFNQSTGATQLSSQAGVSSTNYVLTLNVALPAALQNSNQLYAPGPLGTYNLIFGGTLLPGTAPTACTEL